MSDALIIFYEDKDNPVIHREGLPGLTNCMDYAFSDLFGVVRMGTIKPGAPICKNCFDAEEAAA